MKLSFSLFWLTGILTACGPSETDVTVSGRVTYSAYSTGKIEVSLYQNDREDCVYSACSTSVILDAPGTFSLRARVQGDTMQLLGYALGSSDHVDPSTCVAGGSQTLRVTDHRDISLPLTSGLCPFVE